MNELSTTMRINKFIAYTKGCTRKEVDKMIIQGRIKVNGENASLGYSVREADVIQLIDNGHLVTVHSSISDVLVYKPIFTVVKKVEGVQKKLIYDILPPKYRAYRTKAKLDYMTEGVLLLCNKNDCAKSSVSPSQFLIGLDKQITLHDETILNRYFDKNKQESQSIYKIEENTNKYTFLKLESSYYWYICDFNEANSSDIRNVFAACGKKVLRIVCTRMGNHYLTFDLYKKRLIELSYQNS